LAATGDSKKLTLLHQLKNFGGTRTCTTNKIVALSGTTVDSKIAKIEPSSLLTLRMLSGRCGSVSNQGLTCCGFAAIVGDFTPGDGRRGSL
jgi:hypothetical protein